MGEFWRCWHASLNRWAVRYLYVPLGHTQRVWRSRGADPLHQTSLCGVSVDTSRQGFLDWCCPGSRRGLKRHPLDSCQSPRVCEPLRLYDMALAPLPFERLRLRLFFPVVACLCQHRAPRVQFQGDTAQATATAITTTGGRMHHG